MYLTDLSEDTLEFMLTKILDWGFAESPNAIKIYIPKLTNITI